MMASKLSITEIRENQKLSQVKTGEVFIVTGIDLDARKVTLKNSAGEEKGVSKATLERWYKELTEEGTTGDEIPKSNEPETTGAPATSEDADNDNENDVSGDEATGKSVEANKTGDRGQSTHKHDGDSIVSGKHSDNNTGPVEGLGEAETVADGTGTGDIGTASPVTPSNAGKDKDKAREPKRQEPKNAALMKVRQTIIDTILADSPSIQLKKTTSYDVLREKHNFAEITHGSNRFNVSVMSKCLTEDQLNKVKVNPASFGWSIDADFTVFDETDIEMAVKLIRQSREYRLANPVVRKKKEKK